MTADEMFKELGYKKISQRGGRVHYSKDATLTDRDGNDMLIDVEIWIDSINKSFYKMSNNFYNFVFFNRF